MVRGSHCCAAQQVQGSHRGGGRAPPAPPAPRSDARCLCRGTGHWTPPESRYFACTSCSVPTLAPTRSLSRSKRHSCAVSKCPCPTSAPSRLVSWRSVSLRRARAAPVAHQHYALHACRHLARCTLLATRPTPQGVALRCSNRGKTVLQYFPASALAVDPAARFAQLFRAKPEWAHDELVPYLRCGIARWQRRACGSPAYVCPATWWGTA